MPPTLTEKPASSPGLPGRLLDWVALFERLHAGDRESLIAHFVALDGEDRRLRFGLTVDDAFIARYVQGIDFERDVVFGASSGPAGWVGIGHLVRDEGQTELGLSVLPDARGRGLGAAIFRYAVAHAARAGRDRLYMHCLTSNRAIMSMARSAGMSIQRDAGEAQAYLSVPPYPLFAQMLIGDATAEG